MVNAFDRWPGEPPGGGPSGPFASRWHANTVLAGWEAPLREVFDAVPLGMAIVGPDLRFAQVNEALCHMFACRPDEMIGCAVADVTHPDDVEHHLALADHLFQDEIPSYRIEKRCVSGTGEILWLDLSVTMIRDQLGRPDCELEVVQDITEQRRREEALRRFVATAAHELRTPLMTIGATAEMLGQMHHRMKEADLDEAFSSLQRHGQRANDLITDLLDLARIEHGDGGGRPEGVELGTVAREALEMAPPPPGREVVVEVSDAVRVAAEALRLQRVFVNLLTNAYRYGGDRVRLGGRDDHGEVVISVEDNGPGPPDDVAAMLFEPFSRGDNARTHAGSGLGLSIVKAAAEAFGGSVTYRRSNGWTRFSIRLPKPMPGRVPEPGGGALST